MKARVGTVAAAVFGGVLSLAGCHDNGPELLPSVTGTWAGVISSPSADGKRLEVSWTQDSVGVLQGKGIIGPTAPGGMSFYPGYIQVTASGQHDLRNLAVTLMAAIDGAKTVSLRGSVVSADTITATVSGVIFASPGERITLRRCPEGKVGVCSYLFLRRD